MPDALTVTPCIIIAQKGQLVSGAYFGVPYGRRYEVKTKPWYIRRLNRDKPREIATALMGLYEIDTSVFTEPNQYGLSLLELALIQPEAFWLAELDGEYIGYISVFQYSTPRLFRDLKNQAKDGTLDLPDLIENKYRRLLVPDPLGEDTKISHIYVDAIAIKNPKTIGVSIVQAMSIRKELINAVRTDLSHLIKPSVCTIAINRGIVRELKKLDIPFKHVEGKKKSSNCKKLRELFIWQGRGYGVVDRILNALSDIGFGRVELYAKQDQLRMTTEQGIRLELQKR